MKTSEENFGKNIELVDAPRSTLITLRFPELGVGRKENDEGPTEPKIWGPCLWPARTLSLCSTHVFQTTSTQLLLSAIVYDYHLYRS